MDDLVQWLMDRDPPVSVCANVWSRQLVHQLRAERVHVQLGPLRLIDLGYGELVVTAPAQIVRGHQLHHLVRQMQTEPVPV